MNELLILNGEKVAEELYSKLSNMNGKELAIITIGNDDASKVYIRNKIKDCKRVGLKCVNYTFYPEDYKSIIDCFYTIYEMIEKLKKDKNVIGIMIQRPYPKEFQEIQLDDHINPERDVDGLSSHNLGLTCMGEEPVNYSATPKGILTLLDYYNIPVEGKNVVIIGRSDIVGKPLAAMTLARNATVSICHSKTPKEVLQNYMNEADIIVTAVGKPKFIKKELLIKGIKLNEDNKAYITYNNPVIIDVGINRDENGNLCGDVDYDDVLPYVSAITPVPGGVGPMTRWALIDNCCKNG